MLLRQGADGLGNHSYCRSLTNCDAPWCFTFDPNVPWEECDVPECSLETDAPPATTQQLATSEGENETCFSSRLSEINTSTIHEIIRLTSSTGNVCMKSYFFKNENDILLVVG